MITSGYAHVEFERTDAPSSVLVSKTPARLPVPLAKAVNGRARPATCDFFTVPTLAFKRLYVFVVLSHGRCRILHVNVTQHPTRAWTAQQLFEASPDGEEPRFLHRDGDGTYGPQFWRRAKALGIDEVVSARETPWQNPFVERVIGSIRREYTDPSHRARPRGLIREREKP